MRIQWSSGAAQEMLIRLEQAEQGLNSCLRQTALVKSALDEANVDGDDQALRKMKERFDGCTQRLKSFENVLDDFMSALRKADELFEDAESDLVHMGEELSESKESPRYIVNSGSGGYVSWEPSAYAVMPGMRVSSVTIPDWLENAAAGAGAIPMM